MATQLREPSGNNWAAKFRYAFSGCRKAVRDERSFLVHLPAAGAVVIAGVALSVSLVEWCLLVGAIAAVLSAEIFNTALERMARAVDTAHNPNLGDALDMSSAAVLAAALGAAVIGTIVLGSHLGEFLGWW